MRASIIELLSPCIVTESTYDKIDVIDSCYRAIDESSANMEIVTISSNYTTSTFLDILENIKTTLLQLYTKVMSMLNNYILNNARLAQKYQELIISRFDKLQGPLIFHTYEYPDTRKYPEVYKCSAVVDKYLTKLSMTMEDKHISPEYMEIVVDDIIRDFSHDVLGEDIRVDDIKSSTEKVVTKAIRGKVIDLTLTKKNLTEFLKDISAYKQEKDAVNSTKNAVLSDYQTLKRSCGKYLDSIQGLSKSPSYYEDKKPISYYSDPARSVMIANEYQKYANYKVEMTRMFNAMFTIYQVSYNTKLKLMQQKIESYREIVLTLIVDTGIFAKVNTDLNKKGSSSLPTILKAGPKLII